MTDTERIDYLAKKLKFLELKHCNLSLRYWRVGFCLFTILFIFGLALTFSITFIDVILAIIIVRLFEKYSLELILIARQRYAGKLLSKFCTQLCPNTSREYKTKLLITAKDNALKTSKIFLDFSN